MTKKKQGILTGTRVYLSGSMQYCEDGVSWREELTEFFEAIGVKVFNPYKKPFLNSRDESPESFEAMKLKMKKGDFEKVHEEMKEIRSEDLRIVDVSDFVFAYIDPKVSSWGTCEEIFCANRQKKPIFIVVEGGKNVTPLWMMGVLPPHYFYNTFEEAMDTILSIHKGEKELDSKRWRLLLNEYR